MMVPAFLCIDVEYDEFSPQAGDGAWEGFGARVELIDQVRDQVSALSGVDFHATWFFRMDPLVEHAYGRSDFAVHRHGDLVERLHSYGDGFGIHVHSHRWDSAGGIYSDYTDAAWARHCVMSSADTFERCFGEPPRRSRHGGYFMPEASVDASIARGVEVDLTGEPGLGPKRDDLAFGQFATGPSTDFRGYPRFPYRPSRAHVGVPAADDADCRALVEIPLTSYDYVTALSSLPRRLLNRARLRPKQALPLAAWKNWPDAKTYWDLVDRSIDEGPVPYFAMAVRTDLPGSIHERRVRRVLEHLPHHSIASRLEFIDPLAFSRSVTTGGNRGA